MSGHLAILWYIVSVLQKPTEGQIIFFPFAGIFPLQAFIIRQPGNKVELRTACYMKLFVANISWSVTETELLTFFSSCGDVTTVKIVTDKATGLPKGFGFIDMPDDGEAQRAIDNLNEKELKGRKLSVSQAKARTNTR